MKLGSKPVTSLTTSLNSNDTQASSSTSAAKLDVEAKRILCPVLALPNEKQQLQEEIVSELNSIFIFSRLFQQQLILKNENKKRDNQEALKKSKNEEISKQQQKKTTRRSPSNSSKSSRSSDETNKR